MNLRITRLSAVALTFLATLSVAQAQTPTPLIIDRKVTILLSADEPGPIQEAAKDLAGDLEKILGTRPAIVRSKQEAGTETITIGQRARVQQLAYLPPLSGPESFEIVAIDPSSASVNLALVGEDMRGTIYAIYQFSQTFLGIDPMYYWTGKQPERRTSIRLDSDPQLLKSYAAPVFKYRGIFLNDEDLLTGWSPGDKIDHSAISLDVMNKIYETILRLKGNMVVPGSWIFPDDPQVALAGKRGLILNQHHATPLGVNVARWPKDVPYNFTEHPEILEKAWKNSVAEYGQQEVLWSVGLRGLSDTTYANMDASVKGNDKALGELIGKAIADQMRIVRAVHPDAKFVTDLWSEGAKLAQQGYLKIPPEVTQVWADDGYGFLQDNHTVAAGQGAYYHVAMMNNVSNQLSEMIPIERIDSELGRYIHAGATQFLLLNTSDFRPVVMTAKAVLDIAWNGVPAGDPDSYYKQWSAYEYGDKAAPAIAAVFKDYFLAPAHRGNTPLQYGDMLYHTEGRQMLMNYMLDAPLYYVPGQAPKWELPRPYYNSPGGLVSKTWTRQTGAREIVVCAQAQPRWDAVWNKALAAEALIPPDRRDFYHAQVLAMIAINRESNRILFEISTALQAADAGDKAAAHQAIATALASFDSIRTAEAAAEYGQWQNWYRGDWLTGIESTRTLAETFARFLDNPLTPLPLPVYPRDWEAYYHIMHYEGDRTVDVK